MSTTTGGEPGPPGWYPDPRDPRRHRHWDGHRWSEVSASVPLRTEEGAPVPPGRPRGRATLVAALAVAVVLVVGGAALWWIAGGDDGATTSGDETAASRDDTPEPDPSTSAPDDAPGATTSPEGTAGPAAPDGAPSTTAGGAADPAAPCEVDAAVLLGLLRAHPPLAQLADQLTLVDPRCAGDWASGVARTPDTDEALAVFRREGDGWVFVLVGSEEPCTGLDVPTEAQDALGCGRW